MEGKTKYNLGDTLFILGRNGEIDEMKVVGAYMVFERNCTYIMYRLSKDGINVVAVRDELECFPDRSELEKYLKQD